MILIICIWKCKKLIVKFVQTRQISLLAGVLTEHLPHLCLSLLMCESVSMCVCLPAAKLAHVCVGWRHSVSSGPEDTVNRITVVWRELRRCDRGQYQIPWPILCPVVHTKDKKHRGNRGYCSLFIITTTQHTNTHTHAYRPAVTSTRKWYQKFPLAIEIHVVTVIAVGPGIVCVACRTSRSIN